MQISYILVVKEGDDQGKRMEIASVQLHAITLRQVADIPPELQ